MLLEKLSKDLLATERDLWLTLNSMYSVRDAMPVCLKTALTVSNMDCGEIYLFDNTFNIDFQYSLGLSFTFIENLRCSREWLQLLKSNHLIYTKPDKLSASLNMAFSKEGLRTLGLIPLFSNKRLTGCILVSSHTVDSILPAWQTALESITSKLGDIFIRLNDQEKRKQSEERYRNIIASIKDGYYEVDLAGNITFINDSLGEIVEGSPAEMLGSSYREYCSKEVAAKIHEIFHRVYVGGDHGGFFSSQMIRKNGTSFYFDISLTPIRDTQGIIYGFCGILRDVTQRKLAEENIIYRNRQLVALNTISAAASHSVGLNELVYTLKQVIIDNAKISAGAIFFYNESHNQLDLMTYWGLTETLLKKLVSFPLNSLAETQVIVDDQTILLSAEAVSSDQNLPQLNGHVYIPLQGKGQFQGTIHLFSQESGTFSNCEKVFFKTIGQMIGVAIQKARLFEQVRTGQEKMRTLSRKLMKVQESERRHLARELHDEFGQALTALKINIQTILQKETISKQQLQDSITIIERTLNGMRQLSLDLRPSLLDDLGLKAALRWYVDYHAGLAGLEADFITNLPEERLQPDLETTCYRITQEAFTNVVKHSRATRIEVELLQQDDEVILAIRDNGLGFNVSARDTNFNRNKTMGLLGMQERVELLGGTIEITSSPGNGAEIRAKFQLPAKR